MLCGVFTRGFPVPDDGTLESPASMFYRFGRRADSPILRLLEAAFLMKEEYDEVGTDHDHRWMPDGIRGSD